jgi:hypothetical protein
MSQKAPEIVGKVLQQLSQVWTKVAPQIRSQIIKLLTILIPALEKLSGKLVVKSENGAAAPESGSPGASSNTTILAVRSQAEKLLQQLTQSLVNLRQKLESGDTPKAVDAPTNAESPTALNPASTSSQSLLGDQVRQEVSIAWKFVREQLVPVVLSFLTRVVTKIDPPLTKAYGTVAEKVKATPAITSNWEKLKTSSFWQKASTAIAPVWRTVSEKLATIKIPDSVKPILEKRVATTTLAVALVMLILLKPSPTPRAIAKAPQLPNAVTPTTKRVPDRIAAPEKGESPLSPDQIAIAKIQSQVADVSKKYGEALIQSVQTNFKLGRLIVQLTDAWYQLDASQQERLMTELLGRSHQLNFKKLLIADASQHLIARSPLVGNQMVILKR